MADAWVSSLNGKRHTLNLSSIGFKLEINARPLDGKYLCSVRGIEFGVPISNATEAKAKCVSRAEDLLADAMRVLEDV